MNSRRKSNNETVDARLAGRGIKRIGEYINNNTKIEWECRVCGNRWEATPDNVLNNGRGCPECARRKMKKLVCGVGINDMDEPIRDENGDMYHFYKTWRGILQRCYNKEFQKEHPTYIGAEVCPEWWYLSSFKEWYDRQGNIKGLEIDKDICSDSKLYSPETCVWIPKPLNRLFNDNSNARGCLPCGVTPKGKKFQARIRRFGELKYLGTFPTVEEAELAYLYGK